MNSIKALRKAKGLTQEELADLIPISQNALSRWETGGNEPDLKALIKLSKIFQTTIDNILGEKPENIVLISKKEFEDLQETIKKANEVIQIIEKENPEIKNNFQIQDNHGTINIGNKKGE